MKKDVSVKIGTETFTLFFDNAAISRIEEITGRPIFHYLDVDENDQSKNLSITFIMTALACGLAKHHKGLAKTAKVKQMTDAYPEQLRSYVEAIIKGIMLWQGADPAALEAAITEENGKNAGPVAVVVEPAPAPVSTDGSRS